MKGCQQVTYANSWQRMPLVIVRPARMELCGCGAPVTSAQKGFTVQPGCRASPQRSSKGSSGEEFTCLPPTSANTLRVALSSVSTDAWACPPHLSHGAILHAQRTCSTAALHKHTGNSLAGPDGEARLQQLLAKLGATTTLAGVLGLQLRPLEDKGQ